MTSLLSHEERRSGCKSSLKMFVFSLTHLQQLLFELLHLRQVELTEQVRHWVQTFPFPALTVVPAHLRQHRACVEVAVVTVAVLIVAVGNRDGAAVGRVGTVCLLGELQAFDARDGERYMGPGAVDAIAQAEVVGQLLPQVVLLLTLTLERIQGLLQLSSGDFFQPQCVLQLAVEEDGLLLQHLDFMFQPFILHLRRGGEEERIIFQHIQY